jgi:lysyl-tRNA synthetase class II
VDFLANEFNSQEGCAQARACCTEGREVTQAVFEKLTEPTLMNPVFVTHAPTKLVPFAKRAPEDRDTVEVCACCINGQEVARAWAEQNDPLEQRERNRNRKEAARGLVMGGWTGM